MTALPKPTRSGPITEDRRFQQGVWNTLGYLLLALFLIIWLFPVF